jgi:hypothetical protein
MSKFKSIVNSQIPVVYKKLREMMFHFCLKEGETDVADIRKIAHMEEAVVYMPIIINKDKN